MKSTVLKLFAVLAFVSFMAYAQETTAAAAVENAVAETVASLADMTDAELVNHLTSLAPADFAATVSDAAYDGNGLLARRVINAANQVLAAASEETANAIVDAINNLHGNIVVQNGIIKALPKKYNDVLKDFMPVSHISLPAANPTYSKPAHR